VNRRSEFTIGFALVIAMDCGVSNAAVNSGRKRRDGSATGNRKSRALFFPNILENTGYT